MEKYFDVAVVGSGPSGLTAAIKAKENRPDIRVVLIEKMGEPAKKLSASGNGRGNIANKNCDFLNETLGFFSDTGIATRMDDQGRIYPYSEDAKSVTYSLVRRAERLGAEFLLNTKVENVEASPDGTGGFRIFVCGGAGGESSRGSLRAGRVLIAAGGKSFAVYGSSGDGYSIAKKLGHRIEPLIPALTAVEVKEDIKALKGIRAKAEVSLFDGGNRIFRESGEVQFRDDSLSGICVMNMSSALPSAKRAGEDNPLEHCKIMINFTPDFAPAQLVNFLKSKALSADRPEELLSSVVRGPLACAVLSSAGIARGASVNKMGTEEILKIANGLRGFTLTPIGRKGWKEAQVTKGGVSLEEIDMSTMESKIVKGLYFAGEVIDYDGPCGGYNLNNAWLTGLRAGASMAKSLNAE